MIVGCSSYIYLLNPITYESHGPFRFLTASLPSTLLAAVVYLAVTRLFVIPAGRGGYSRLGTAAVGRLTSYRRAS